MSKSLSFNTEQADEDQPRIGMAPLVDIVLLLICFYLLVMQSMQARADDQIKLPAMANHLTEEQAPAELVLNIHADGTMRLNGEAIDPGALVGVIHHEQQRAAETGQDITMVIRADGRQHYGMLDAAMSACREAGMRVVTIRTTEDRTR